MAEHSQIPANLLAQRVGEVLHYVWDPIGVSGIPQARDEYDMYVLSVVSLLENRASASDLAKHLNSIAVDRMGLQSNLEHANQVANILLDWHETLHSSHA